MDDYLDYLVDRANYIWNNRDDISKLQVLKLVIEIVEYLKTKEQND